MQGVDYYDSKYSLLGGLGQVQSIWKPTYKDTKDKGT